MNPENGLVPLLWRLLNGPLSLPPARTDRSQAVETIGMVYFGIRLRPPSMLDNIVGMFSGMSK